MKQWTAATLCPWLRAKPLALGVILCVALAACGDLPRPFQPEAKSTQAWLGPGDIAWGSVLVLPIAGLPTRQSAALVDEVVEALQLRDIPASSHAGGRGSIVLSGHVAAVAGKLRWSLITPDGATALRFDEAKLDASTVAAEAADLEAIAARAAGRVAALLKPPTTDDPGHPPRVPVVIEAVRGAPGDGGIALARAMRHSLARNGVSVVDDADKGPLAIQGWVSITKDDTAADDATLTIAWDLLHPEGTRLGTVTQSNRVGTDRLAGTWGVLPRLIARAGAPGIAQLLNRPEIRRVAKAARQEASTESPIGTPIEAPLALLIEASAAVLSRAAPVAVLSEAPLALSFEASPAPHGPPARPMSLTEAAPIPPLRLPPEPRFKPRAEAASAAKTVLVEAPIAVSVTVR